MSEATRILDLRNHNARRNAKYRISVIAAMIVMECVVAAFAGRHALHAIGELGVPVSAYAGIFWPFLGAFVLMVLLIAAIQWQVRWASPADLQKLSGLVDQHPELCPYVDSWLRESGRFLKSDVVLVELYLKVKASQAVTEALKSSTSKELRDGSSTAA